MRSSTRGPVGSFRRAQGQSPSRGLQSLMRISAWCRVVLGDFTPQERGRGGRTVSRGMQGSLLAVSGALGLREPWGCRRTRPGLSRRPLSQRGSSERKPPGSVRAWRTLTGRSGPRSPPLRASPSPHWSWTVFHSFLFPSGGTGWLGEAAFPSGRGWGLQ